MAEDGPEDVDNGEGFRIESIKTVEIRYDIVGSDDATG